MKILQVTWLQKPWNEVLIVKHFFFKFHIQLLLILEYWLTFLQIVNIKKCLNKLSYMI